MVALEEKITKILRTDPLKTRSIRTESLVICSAVVDLVGRLFGTLPQIHTLKPGLIQFDMNKSKLDQQILTTLTRKLFNRSDGQGGVSLTD